MPDIEVGRWPYADRHRVMDAIADALYRVPSPVAHDQGTVVLVRVTAPHDGKPEVSNGDQ